MTVIVGGTEGAEKVVGGMAGIGVAAGKVVDLNTGAGVADGNGVTEMAGAHAARMIISIASDNDRMARPDIGEYLR